MISLLKDSKYDTKVWVYYLTMYMGKKNRNGVPYKWGDMHLYEYQYYSVGIGDYISDLMNYMLEWTLIVVAYVKILTFSHRYMLKWLILEISNMNFLFYLILFIVM